MHFRSGSTFTGKLLESGEPSITSYNNEPLRKFTRKLELAWQEEDYHRASKGATKEFNETELSGDFFFKMILYKLVNPNVG